MTFLSEPRSCWSFKSAESTISAGLGSAVDVVAFGGGECSILTTKHARVGATYAPYGSVTVIWVGLPVVGLT